MFSMKVYPFNEVYSEGKSAVILSGYDHFIGDNEKRRNKEIVHVELPYNFGNYSTFYAGTNEILKSACNAMLTILNNPGLSEIKKALATKSLLSPCTLCIMFRRKKTSQN